MTWTMKDVEFTPVLAIAAALFAICVEARLQIGRSRRRTRDLKLCGELLDQHRSALELFLASPDAPMKLKQALIRYSEVSSDREAVHRIVSVICSGERRTQRDAESTRALFLAVEKLRESHPDLALAFHTAAASCTGAMLYRWPETSDMFREYVTKAVVDSRKGADLFARFTRYGSDNGGHIPMGPSGVIPI